MKEDIRCLGDGEVFIKKRDGWLLWLLRFGGKIFVRLVRRVYCGFWGWCFGSYFFSLVLVVSI